MRLFVFALLSACGGPVGDDFVPPDIDATTTRFEAGSPFDDVFVPSIEAAVETGPIYNGGPLECGTCTCDGTLYACLEQAFGSDGGCASGGGGGPKSPMSGDAGDASDDAPSCGKGTLCLQIPIACLPKPTCGCIEKETKLTCEIAANGNGFILACPPPMP